MSGPFCLGENLRPSEKGCAIMLDMAAIRDSGDPAAAGPINAALPTGTGEAGSAELETALDHAWRWFELRVSHGLQMLNFAVLAFALLSAAYVSALSDKLYGVAGAVALLAAAVAVATNLVARRQRQIGWIAAEPIREIQRPWPPTCASTGPCEDQECSPPARTGPRQPGPGSTSGASPPSPWPPGRV